MYEHLGSNSGISSGVKAAIHGHEMNSNQDWSCKFVELFELAVSCWKRNDATATDHALKQMKELLSVGSSNGSCEIPDGYIESVLEFLWKVLVSLDPHCAQVLTSVCDILVLIFRNSITSLPLFYKLSPLERLMELAAVADYSPGLHVHEVLRLLTPLMSSVEASAFIEFLISQVASCESYLQKPQLVQTVLVSAAFAAKRLDDESLVKALPGILEVIRKSFDPSCRYVMHNYTSAAIRELVKRNVNIFDADPLIFSAMVQSLSDSRMQPYDNYIKTISLLLSNHPSPELIGAISVEPLLSALDISRVHDGDDGNTVGLFAIFGKLISLTPSFISQLCTKEIIELFASFACAKSFKICRVATNFFWLVALHGTIAEKMSFMCNTSITDAMIRNLEVEDDDFLQGTIAPALTLTLEQVQTLTGEHHDAADHVLQSIFAGIRQLDPCPPCLEPFLSPPSAL